MKTSYTLMIVWALLTSLNATCLPKLSSYPSAQATIFLDFDGQTVVSASWNNGSPLVCAPAAMTDAQITEAFNRVSEDYRPFNINITTDSTVFFAAPLNKRIRIIITPTSAFAPGVGGISYTGSFTWGDDTPGFVFSDRLANSPKFVGECCTHESGHTVGLSHQSTYDNTCNLVDTYNTGAGTGEISWAPVMGNSYYKNLTGWNNGLTPNSCTVGQDNLSIITTTNGFTYRTDDYSDDPNTNPAVVTVTNQLFSKPGIITTPTDKDVFKFVFTTNGKLHLDAIPYSVGANLDGADLDIKVTLLNSAKQVIGTYDPSTLLSATIDTTLNAGTYFVSLQGTGNQNTTNYGSLGSYNIGGSFIVAGTLPIKEVALTGKTVNSTHNLSWNIISDDPIKTIEVQTSTDARFFSTIAGMDAKQQSFTYTPVISGDIYYKLKVTSTIGQVVYSNIITLKSAGQVEKSFKVSTMVHNDITVNASESYQYKLADLNGRIIQEGKSTAGTNKINIGSAPSGMYIIQIIANAKTQTERIIKQ